MSIQQYYLIFAVVLFSSLSANTIEPEVPQEPGTFGEVVFVSVLYRHGDRTPVEPYPKDPYGDLKYWTTGWGQLTTIGMRQHYELGKWMRNRYRTLLANDYVNDDIYILSTDVDRTLMSAMSHLAGMYPPTPNHTFDGKLPWQPIPVHTLAERDDAVLIMKKPCPRYEDELEKVKKTNTDLVNFMEKYHEVFNYISENTGSDVHDPRTAKYVHSCLHIEELKNLTLPEWTKKVYPEPLRTIARMGFLIPTFTPELGRLKSGPLLKEMLGNMHLKIKKEMKPDRKMYMYSAHDTTIANLLNTMKIIDPGMPPYIATVLIELRKKEDNYFVSILYKTSSAEPRLLTLPGCSQYCPIEKLDKLLSPVVPEDWEKECNYQTIYPLGYMNLLIFAPFLLCGLIGLSLLVFTRERTDRDSYYRYHTVSTNIN